MRAHKTKQAVVGATVCNYRGFTAAQRRPPAPPLRRQAQAITPHLYEYLAPKALRSDDDSILISGAHLRSLLVASPTHRPLTQAPPAHVLPPPLLASTSPLSRRRIPQLPAHTPGPATANMVAELPCESRRPPASLPVWQRSASCPDPELFPADALDAETFVIPAKYLPASPSSRISAV